VESRFEVRNQRSGTGGTEPASIEAANGSHPVSIDPADPTRLPKWREIFDQVLQQRAA
jgi:hypothetical protein